MINWNLVGRPKLKIDKTQSDPLGDKTSLGKGFKLS